MCPFTIRGTRGGLGLEDSRELDIRKEVSDCMGVVSLGHVVSWFRSEEML